MTSSWEQILESVERPDVVGTNTSARAIRLRTSVVHHWTHRHVDIDTQTQRDRQTDTQIHRYRHTDTDRQTERQTDAQTRRYRHRHRGTNSGAGSKLGLVWRALLSPPFSFSFLSYPLLSPCPSFFLSPASPPPLPCIPRLPLEVGPLCFS